MTLTRNIMAIGLSVLTTFAVNLAFAQTEDKGMENFIELSDSKWEEVFYDSCTEDWKNNWSLDGKEAKITNQKMA